MQPLQFQMKRNKKLFSATKLMCGFGGGEEGRKTPKAKTLSFLESKDN